MPRSHLPSHVSRDQPSTDADLLAGVRSGDTQAYADLYDRYHQPALRMAIAVAGPSRAEDLVAEAFARTLRLLLGGSGPQEAFRPYLFAAIRNVNTDVAIKERRALPTADLGVLDRTSDSDPRPGYPAHDAVADALRALPRRWQDVLWLTAVEGRPLAEVALRLGSNPNAVAQLAFRAREALRQAYVARLAEIAAEDALTSAAVGPAHRPTSRESQTRHPARARRGAPYSHRRVHELDQPVSPGGARRSPVTGHGDEDHRRGGRTTPSTASTAEAS